MSSYDLLRICVALFSKLDRQWVEHDQSPQGNFLFN